MNQKITFSLRYIPFLTILEHLKKNSLQTVPKHLSKYDWIYLSNFYSSENTQPGLATRMLQDTLDSISKPYILCCEPILGNNIKSITAKNCNLTADQRYKSLCTYYQNKFNLYNEIQTRCTLKTELLNNGIKCDDLERKFMWGLNFEKLKHKSKIINKQVIHY